MTGRRRIPKSMASCQWLNSIGHLAGAISTRGSAWGAGSLDSMVPTSIGCRVRAVGPRSRPPGAPLRRTPTRLTWCPSLPRTPVAAVWLPRHRTPIEPVVPFQAARGLSTAASLVGLGLVSDVPVMGKRRLILSDKGLGVLARKDRTSVGDIRKRWSANPMDRHAPVEWRNVSDRRSRQLLRNLEHPESTHWLPAVLSSQGTLPLHGGCPA